LFYFGALMIGLLAGKRFAPARLAGRCDALSSAGLLCLLYLMGIKLSLSPQILTNLPRLGLHALALAVGTTVGSTGLAFLAANVDRLFVPRRTRVRAATSSRPAERPDFQRGIPIWLPCLLLMAGTLSGLALFSLVPSLRAPTAPLTDILVQGSLAWLLLAVGLQLGAGGEMTAGIREAGAAVLPLALCVATGSIAGAVCAGYLLPGRHSPGDLAALGAGFGWYSLSGIMLTELRGVELGTLAFLANLTREMIAVMAAPYLAGLGPWAPVAAAGATAMDSTLPVIARVTHGRGVLLALGCGMLLSALVPLLVPLLAH